jgi:retron-type reverse transcriptase
LINKGASNVEFKRVYIPKKEGSPELRPLGVPTKSWRVYLHMMNGMIFEMVSPLIGNDQHAYIPGRGTMTAWKSIISKLKDYDFVYETDLKGFFNNINTAAIIHILRKVGLPSNLIN